MKGILEGLAHMHEQFIVHRDIKPANIMVEHDGTAKIVDFGLATDVREKKHLLLRCGTPGYIAPEILRINKNRGERLQTVSDIFSAGSIMYELIYGKYLFGDSDD